MAETVSANLQNDSKRAARNVGIFLGNILGYIPNGAIATLLKYPKFGLQSAMTEQVLKEGLVHITPSQEIADKIIESNLIFSSSRTTSYDVSKYAFMFAGPPTVDNFIKNIVNAHGKINPYVNPEQVVYGVKFTPEVGDLENYKVRALNDNAIMYKGNCVLPPNRAQTVALVPDLVRDENGNPVRNENGEYTARFREALPEELVPGENRYKAKQDYLDFMAEKAKDNLLISRTQIKGPKRFEEKSKFKPLNVPMALWNSIASVIQEADIETAFFLDNVPESFRQGYFDKFKQLGKSMLDGVKKIFAPKQEIEPTVDEAMDSFKLSEHDVFLDKDFSIAFAQLVKEGHTQTKLKDNLEEFSMSEAGSFYSDKSRHLAMQMPLKGGIHGTGHTERVALTAMMIGQKEGLFDGEDKSRVMELLSTAATFHDIGRVLDVGPHAARGARKVKKMDLRYQDGQKFSDEDRKIVMALIEGHEGKPQKIEKLMKKYKITDPKTMDMVRALNSCVRDADALDRVRLDSNYVFGYKADLKPQYLATDAGKSMVMSNIELFHAHNKMGKNIMPFVDYHKEDRVPVTRESEFDKSLKVKINEQEVIQIVSKDEKTKSDPTKSDDWIK